LGSHFVAHDEFQLVSRRIDKLERSVGSVVTKIDGVIRKLETLDRMKEKKAKAGPVNNGSVGGGASRIFKSPSRPVSRQSNKVGAVMVQELDGLSINESEVSRAQKLAQSHNDNNTIPVGIPLGVGQNVETTSEVRARSRQSRPGSSSSRRPPTGKSLS